MKTSLNLAVMNAYMDIITINCLSFKIEDCDICNQFSINCDKFIDLFDNLMVNAKNAIYLFISIKIQDNANLAIIFVLNVWIPKIFLSEEGRKLNNDSLCSCDYGYKE